MIPEKRKILITGASGLIGTILRKALMESYDLYGIDVEIITGFDCLVADMKDLSTIKHAFLGKDVVIDLAAIPDRDSPWEIIYQNNMVATYNTLEAARLTGVKRVIFASSNHTTGMYENDKPYSDIVNGNYEGLDPEDIPLIGIDSPLRPDGHYGVGKAFGECMGRYYSDTFGISVLCLRIGTLNKEGCPVETRQFSTLLTHPDLVQLVERCIEAPDDLEFGIYYGVSNNKWRFWDIANSRQEIGYNPEGNAESWRDG